MTLKESAEDERMARYGNSLGWPKAVIDAREKQETCELRDKTRDSTGTTIRIVLIAIAANREPRPRVTRFQPTDIGQWLWQLIRGCLLSDNQRSAYDNLAGLYGSTVYGLCTRTHHSGVRGRPWSTAGGPWRAGVTPAIASRFPRTTPE